MAAQYDYWSKKKKSLSYLCNALPHADYTEELINTYNRHLEIIDEILDELSIEFDDDQYTETTSWKYEEELKTLTAKEAELEPIVEQLIREEEHRQLLEDMGMTQEEYDAYQREQESKKPLRWVNRNRASAINKNKKN